MERGYLKRRANRPPAFEFAEGDLVMVRNFYRTRLATPAIGPFLIVQRKERSAVLKPLFKGGGRTVEYNLADLAPL